MAIAEQPNIAYAERVEGGLRIVFVDGKSAIYSAALLRATLTTMEEIDALSSVGVQDSRH